MSNLLVHWTDQNICSDCRKIQWKDHFRTSKFNVLLAGGITLKGYREMTKETTCGFCSFLVAARKLTYPNASFEASDKEFGSLVAVWPARLSATEYEEHEAAHCRRIESSYSVSYRWRISAIAPGDGAVFQLVYPFPIDIVPLTEHTPESNRYRSAVRIPATGLMDRTLLKRWLAYCKSEHKEYDCSIGPRGLGCGRCQTWTGLATCANLPFRFRVIDVATFRVVDAPPDCPYVALSYVWGTANVYKAYKADFQPRPDGTCFLDLSTVADQIPQTVLDAIEVVKMLGARYLWVDALCIAQDDDQELRDTLPAMCLIYEAATVTIVAAFGSDANAGLPGARPGSRDAQQLNFSAQGITLVHTAPQLLDALDESVWKTRGWTFQEDCFSRRKIIFTGSHVYWKCSYERICEDTWYDKGVDYLTSMLSPDQPRRAIPVQPFSEQVEPSHHRPTERNPQDAAPAGLGVFFHTYDLSVTDFTKRNLTSQNDILRAFAGIAASLGTELGSREFINGLPRILFDAALLWKAAPQWELAPWDTSADVEYFECDAIPITKTHQTVEWKMQQLGTSQLRRRAGFPSWAWSGWVGAVEYERVGNTSSKSAGEQVKVISDIFWPWDCS